MIFMIRLSCHMYFEVKLGDQDKSLDPHIICRICLEHLRNGLMERGDALNLVYQWFGVKNHYDDCYLCFVNINGINRKNNKHWPYPEL